MSFDEPKSTDNAMHQVMHEARDYQRIEVITGRRRRRNWTDDERAQIVAESAVPGANISDVAHRRSRFISCRSPLPRRKLRCLPRRGARKGRVARPADGSSSRSVGATWS